jgi:cytochrome o ubiquinol oxidase subunit II
MTQHKKKLSNGRFVRLVLLALIGLGLLLVMLLQGSDLILLSPKGLIASEQHRLMLTMTLIMLGFALPVLFCLYFFAWKYRESNPKATHNPQAGRSKLSVFLFWALPTTLMLVLASLMVPATFRLEPQDSIKAAKSPLTIQVVALRWKWLFIYPQQNVATVNYVQIPVDTPVQFELTADEAPMNSFWIPHLGGQLYAMTGHNNRLNLMADTVGDYGGSAAEISGPGFAGMRFTARVGTGEAFDAWVAKTRQAGLVLDAPEYQKLLEPSEDNSAAFYASADPSLFSTILNKYEGSHHHNMEHVEREAIE